MTSQMGNGERTRATTTPTHNPRQILAIVNKKGNKEVVETAARRWSFATNSLKAKQASPLYF